MIRLIAILMVLSGPVFADTVMAARTIPARTIINPGDLMVREGHIPGTLTDMNIAVGQETRVALYAGRPVRPGDIGPPAVVDRNDIVLLVYQSGGITISTEGRALDRAGPGDLIRVMNLSSRATVTARIGSDGSAYVAQ